MKKSVLNSIRIYENLSKFNNIDFWCDYLRLSYTHWILKFDELLFWVDSDNSNFWTLEICDHVFTYTKMLTPNWFALTFLTEFNWVVVPIFQYVHFNKQSTLLFWKSAKLDVYGAYFRLESIGEFGFHSLFHYIQWLSVENPEITRFDYRVDYFSRDKFIDVPLPEDILWYIHSKSSRTEWKKWNDLVDWHIWNSETWRYAIRYYDKKIDTNKKDKWFLYTDFLDYKSVHRLEIEFWRAFCREYSLSDISFLEDKIIWVLGINWMIYDKSIFYQYSSDSEITLENAWNYIKRFQNLSSKLFKSWYNPLRIIEQQIIWQYWIDVARGLIDDFLQHSLKNEWIGKI